MSLRPFENSYPIANIGQKICICGHLGGFHAIGKPHACLSGRLKKAFDKGDACKCAGFTEFEGNDVLKDLCSK